MPHSAARARVYIGMLRRAANVVVGGGHGRAERQKVRNTLKEATRLAVKVLWLQRKQEEGRAGVAAGDLPS